MALCKSRPYLPIMKGSPRFKDTAKTLRCVSKGRHQKTSDSAYSAAQFCHSSVGKRCGYSSAITGTFIHKNDRDLHAYNRYFKIKNQKSVGFIMIRCHSNNQAAFSGQFEFRIFLLTSLLLLRIAAIRGDDF